MPLPRSQRPDPRRSTSYCSTVTIVFFVALCLLGVWMMSSPTVVTVGVSSSDTNSEVKQEVPETDGSLFEDSQGDPITNSNTATSESHSNSSKEKVEPEGETTQGENSVQGSEDNKDVLADTSKTETYSDANGKLEGGEIINEGAGVVKEGRDASSDGSNKNTGSKGVHEDKSLENAVETANAEQNFDQTKRDGQKQNGAHSYKTTVNDDQQPSEVNMKMAQDRSNVDTAQGEKSQSQMVEQYQDKDTKEDSDERKPEGKGKEQGLEDLLPSGSQLELLNETNTQNGAWSTQVTESKNEKELQASSSSKKQSISSSWKLCNVTAGPDYIPCLDNEEAIKKLRTTMHYEHRERHCPESAPTCLVPLPEAYKKSIEWPSSRDKIWYHNVPHTQLATVKGHQNWVKVSGEYLTFPGGGTQFKHGALHYIGIIQEALPDIAWGKRSRVVLDVGCGVASFGGYLFDSDVLTMSLAPKDEHEAQVQFALERGIPAISAVMGTTRLPFPGRVFDVIHCARCRVPWHIEGGKLLLELNRLLRPGGYFVWSATPVYKTGAEDVEIWKAMQDLTKAMCWEMVTKTRNVIDRVGLAIYRKPSDNLCYEKRKKSKPPLCQESDDPNAAWNVSLQACMHKLPVDRSARGAKWPEQWPLRLKKAPYWLNRSQIGVYGKAAPEDFKADQEHWKKVVSKSYLNGMGIDWAKVRNVMDMRSVYGGFAAALQDMKLWVMNIVPIDSPDTLPIIYERGLFGMYHDWCESFSTYPRTYDLLHADHLFSTLKKRCKLLPVIVEVDRILRPEGKVIIRDTAEVINEVERIARSLNWEIRMTFSKQNEGLLCVMKTTWRPKELERTAAAALAPPNQDRRTGS